MCPGTSVPSMTPFGVLLYPYSSGSNKQGWRPLKGGESTQKALRWFEIETMTIAERKEKKKVSSPRRLICPPGISIFFSQKANVKNWDSGYTLFSYSREATWFWSLLKVVEFSSMIRCRSALKFIRAELISEADLSFSMATSRLRLDVKVASFSFTEHLK